ncbi:hypothetical protein [Chelativorans salis]|uniref:SnoaL-like domain-containing protein n=1 Tax=Chelativorans salis TaxID=2978478 RepID=A0ABT2LR20_9HYPH|nr:hypothetical protein [Chelativorans sp. EGI FJ00035]MCT7376801.1 hypothetical protein [Chelativorans sp. EGI FJ00035]
MKRRTTVLAAGLALIAGTAPIVAQENICAQEGMNSPLELHKAWILKGWELRQGDPEFVFAEEMDRYYDLEDPQGVYYDNFAPNGAPTFDNAAEYGANWEAPVNSSRTIRHALTEHHDQIVGERVASTTLGFVGDIVRLTGERITFNARSQLGWECDSGEWVIRHELNSAWLVEPKEITPFSKRGRIGNDRGNRRPFLCRHVGDR